MIDWLINGHNFYIAAAFGLSTLTLIFNFWLPLRKRRRILNSLKKDAHQSTP
jgi:heme exporter protein CcmD